MDDSVLALPPTLLRGREVASGHRPDGSLIPGRYHIYPELGAGAGLWTTPTDLARFALGVQAARRGHAGGVVSKEAATLMTTKVTEQTGLGFFIAKDRYFEHGGSNEGFVGRLVAHRDDGYGAVILTNSDNGGPLMDEIFRAIAGEYGWEGWLPEPVKEVRVAPTALEEYVGRYQVGGDMIVAVSRLGEHRLLARPSLGEPFELLPIAADTFVRRDFGIRHRFAPDGRLERLSPTGDVWDTGRRVTETARVPSQDVEDGRIDAAIEGYQRLRAAALPDDPTGSERDLGDWAFELLGLQDFRRAAALLEVASALYPSSVKLWYGLGEACLGAGRIQESERAFRRSVESDTADRVTVPDEKQSFVSEASSRLREIDQRRRDGVQ